VSTGTESNGLSGKDAEMVFGSDLRCSLDRRSMLGMGVVVAVSGVLSGCSGSTESADSSASASKPATPSGGSV